MHPTLVVDASVVVSQASSHESRHKESTDWLDLYLSADGLLIEPALILVEVASAISRQTGQTMLAQHIVQTLNQSATFSIVPLDAALLDEAVRMASNLGLRAGDAIYVALAHQLGIPLVSWDKEQLQRSSGLIETYTPDNYPF